MAPVAWLAASLVYLAVFYAVPLSYSADGEPIPRATVLLMAFTPEFYLETWTGGGMRTAVLDRAPVVLGAVMILTAAYCAGSLCLMALGVGRRDLWPLEMALFATAVGLHVLSLTILVVGLLGWLTSAVLWLFLFLAVVLAFVAVVVGRSSRTFRAEDARGTRTREATAPENRWLWVGLPFVVVILLGAMLPPWEFDVREYHLQVPKEWFREGRITFLPHNVYGNMPLGAEVYAIPAMAVTGGERDWWWGALVGKTVMACFAPLTALMLFAAGRRFFSPLAGAAAALVYISIPWVAHTAMAGLNDHVLAFYVFAAFYALLLWKADVHANRRWRFLALSGFLAGAAAACKYTGLLFAVAPLGLLATTLALRVGKSPVRSAALAAGVFALAALLGGGLWYGKNWALAGNPVYPLMYDVFGGRTRTPELDARWRQAHRVPRSEDSGPYAPSRLAAAVAQVSWRSEWLSPLLVPLVLLAPFSATNRRAILLTTGMTLFLLAVWWLFTHRIDRFWIPALPMAALLAGAGAAWRDDRRWRWLVLAAISLGLVANFLVIASPLIGDNRFFVALEELRTDVRDPETNPGGRVHPAHQHLNQVAPGDGAVLLVGDAQPFDLQPRAFYNTTFDPSVFEALMKGRSAEERRAALRSRNITHVFVDWGEIARYRSPGNYGFTDFVQPKVFDELVSQGVLRPTWPEAAFAVETTPTGYPPPRVYEVVR